MGGASSSVCEYQNQVKDGTKINLQEILPPVRPRLKLTELKDFMKEEIKQFTPGGSELSTKKINDLFDEQTKLNLSLSKPANCVEDEEEGEEEEVPIECAICYESEKEGMLKLNCGHYYHDECILGWMKNLPKKGERFQTNNARCPMCRDWILTKENKQINDLCKPVKENFSKMCEILSKSDGIEMNNDQKKKLDTDSSMSQKEVLELIKDFMFFMCYDCGNLYFGGMKNCGQDINENDENAALPDNSKDHLCVDCVNKRTNNEYDANCKVHGKSFIAYKCRFCCSVANWFCFGTTHFCEPCHRKYPSQKVIPCPGPPTCSGNHRKNGTGKECEQCLGCILCRNHF